MISCIYFVQGSTSILIVVAAYLSKNNVYLNHGVNRWLDICESGYEVTVLIQTVEMWSINEMNRFRNLCQCMRTNAALPIFFEVFDRDVGLKLTMKHRKTIEINVNDFDLFIYQEDDMAVGSEHIRIFFKYTGLINADILPESYHNTMQPEISAVGMMLPSVPKFNLCVLNKFTISLRLLSF